MSTDGSDNFYFHSHDCIDLNRVSLTVILQCEETFQVWTHSGQLSERYRTVCVMVSDNEMVTLLPYYSFIYAVYFYVGCSYLSHKLLGFPMRTKGEQKLYVDFQTVDAQCVGQVENAEVRKWEESHLYAC